MTKSGRQAAREALAAAQQEAARLARANEEDLAGFFSAHGRLGEVDDWLAERMAALTAQAEERRAVLRLQCGRALRAIRDRGQNVAGLAVMARMTPKTVRELIKAAEQDERTPESDDGQVVAGEAAVPGSAGGATANETAAAENAKPAVRTHDSAPVNEATESIGQTSAI
jgi:hypothetical protein